MSFNGSQRSKRQGPPLVGQNTSDMADSEDYDNRNRGDRDERRDERRDDRRLDHSSARWGDGPGAHRRQDHSFSRQRNAERDPYHEEYEEEVPERQRLSLEALFRQQRTDIAADTAAEIQRAVAQATVPKFEALDIRLQAQDNRLAALEDARARSAFESASARPTTPPRPVPKRGFERDADPKVLKCNIENRAKVALEEMQRIVDLLIREKGWEPSIAELKAKDVDSFFVLEFSSDANGADQAEQILSLLYDKPNKKWREMYAADVDGNQVRMYLGKDEAPRISKLQGASKRFAKDIVAALGAGHKAYFRHHDGVIVVDSIPTAKLEYVVDPVTRKQLVDMRIQWKEKALTDLNLLEHKEPISAAFISRENSTWVS
jgi:hypothetical protein